MTNSCTVQGRATTGAATGYFQECRKNIDVTFSSETALDTCMHTFPTLKWFRLYIFLWHSWEYPVAAPMVGVQWTVQLIVLMLKDSLRKDLVSQIMNNVMIFV